MWQYDKAWADKFLNEVKQILGLYLIGEASKEDDAIKNTDLIVLKMEAVRIAVRIRRHQYLLKYRDEFTIRKSRPSNNESEISKIVSGWGDYFFYGFSNASEDKIESWVLIDLNQFRKWFVSQIFKLPAGQLPGSIKNNNDGSSDFLIFSKNKLPKDVIIAEF